MFIFSFILAITPATLFAQKGNSHDTTYYTTYPGTLTTRIYFSKKYASFTLPATDDHTTDLQYKSNEPQSIGIGATWNNFSLNVGAGLGLINPNSTDKGKTKSLDLQLHLYPHKWAIDALAIFHTGHYLDPDGYQTLAPNTYYVRPDIKLNLLGVSMYRVPNAERFSYHAALIQNEWQKKSAGSLLFGGEAFYGLIRGDSSFVPSQVEKGFDQSGINHLRFFSAGPGIGYAYTLVIQKHFFITGSAVVNVDLNYATEDGVGFTRNQFSVTPVPVFKTAIGYNSNKWDVSANWMGNAFWIGSASSAESYFFQSGNYRLILARRIDLRKHK
jgi:Domain of unknown function (DUF4421)